MKLALNTYGSWLRTVASTSHRACGEKHVARAARPGFGKWADRVFLPVVLIVLGGGCQELVHMGQISDRESTGSICGAAIEQQQPDGTWKRLGETDGNGKWWILKDKVKGGGKIRISKPGYYPVLLHENEFMQESNILLVPNVGGDSGFDPGGAWQSGVHSRGPRGPE